MIHDQHPSLSLLDLNRAGVGLMEIVSKPDMRSSEEAALYVRSIIRLLRKIDACSANMQLVSAFMKVICNMIQGRTAL